MIKQKGNGKIEFFARGFNILLLVNRPSMLSTRKKKMNNIITQPYQNDTDKELHLKRADTQSYQVHMIHSPRQTMLFQNQTLPSLKQLKPQKTFSDHSKIKLEINRKICR